MERTLDVWNIYSLKANKINLLLELVEGLTSLSIIDKLNRHFIQYLILQEMSIHVVSCGFWVQMTIIFWSKICVV
jgi:hypothetical protein